jgi:hypothetical protein
MRERGREKERNGSPKSNVLTSGSLVASPKPDPDYSVFITKWYLFIYLFILFIFYFFPQFDKSRKMSSHTQVEHHWIRGPGKGIP